MLMAVSDIASYGFSDDCAFRLFKPRYNMLHPCQYLITEVIARENLRLQAREPMSVLANYLEACGHMTLA